jgi:DNA ligase-associated metallophosphoesterase
MEKLANDTSIQISVAGTQLVLLSKKAVFYPAQKALIISDLHLGKINHFRKAGVPVPLKANEKNIESLLGLIQRSNPTRVIFLGDLFHSHYNEEWEVLGQLIRHFAAVSFELVIGNHDILSEHQYRKHSIVLHTELILGPFLLTHQPTENYAGELYNLAGHVHPGAHLIGKGRQKITLPCFYFGEHQGLLPAFGTFTGLSRIIPKKDGQVFIIVDNKILQV